MESESKAVLRVVIAGYCSSRTWPFTKAKLFLVSFFITMLLAQRNEEVLIPALCDSVELYSGVSSSFKRLVLMHSYLYCVHTALGPNWHML